MNIPFLLSFLAASSGVAFGAWAQPTKTVKPLSSTSRTEIRSTATQMAAGIAAAEAALEPAELAIAERVHTGTIEDVATVAITLDNGYTISILTASSGLPEGEALLDVFALPLLELAVLPPVS